MSDILRRPAVVVGGLAACATCLVAYGIYRKYAKPGKRQWREVGELCNILIHPVKACRGIELAQAECTALGMKSSEGLYDRHYIILDDEDRFVTMRQKSALALIQTSQSDDGKYLQLDAPDMPTVKVPLYQAPTKDVIRFRLWRLDTEGNNCGEEVANWLNTFLKTTGYKLVVYTPDLEPCKNIDDPKWGTRAKVHEKSIYQDLAHFHLFGIESLDELNSKLEKKVTMRNFRPNLVVRGASAYEEDNWKYIRIGDKVILRTTHLCGRCKQTTVDPETGIASDQPLKTLRATRMTDPSHPDHKSLGGAPVFGINLNIEVEGTLAVGDTVYVSDY